MKRALLTVMAVCLIVVPASFARQNSNATKRSNSEKTSSNVDRQVQHRVDYLTTVLSLSTSQQEQAKKIFTNAQNANSPVFANLRTERQDLRRAVESDEPASKITNLSESIGNNAGKLVANQAIASEQFRKILTSEQQTKLTKLQHEMRGGGFGMGPFAGRLAD